MAAKINLDCLASDPPNTARIAQEEWEHYCWEITILTTPVALTVTIPTTLRIKTSPFRANTRSLGELCGAVVSHGDFEVTPQSPSLCVHPIKYVPLVASNPECCL